MLDPMETPNTRAEFERRFFILRELIKNGKLLFPRGIKRSELGLLDIRSLPNGRIDFLSVNESARLQANMAAHMQPRLEAMREQGDIGDSAGNMGVVETHPEEKPGPKTKRDKGDKARKTNKKDRKKGRRK